MLEKEISKLNPHSNREFTKLTAKLIRIECQKKCFITFSSFRAEFSSKYSQNYKIEVKILDSKPKPVNFSVSFYFCGSRVKVRAWGKISPLLSLPGISSHLELPTLTLALGTSIDGIV